MEVSKKLIRDAVWALRRANTQCRRMHHEKNDAHHMWEICPVEIRIDEIFRRLQLAAAPDRHAAAREKGEA